MKRILAALALAAMTAFPAELPRKAPKLTIEMLDGQDQLLSKYLGKVVVVEFFNPTCSHCQNTAKILVKLYKELGPKGFQPIAVAAAVEHKPGIANFIGQFGITFPVGYTSTDKAMLFLQHSIMAPFMVPQMAFIDKQGVIREQHVGGDDLFKDEENNIRKKVIELLAAGTAPAAKKSAEKK